MSYLEKLFEISSDSIDKSDKLKVPYLLKELYFKKNGFLSFEGAFRVLPISNSFGRNLYSWNNFLIKEINLEGIFFADNILGDGFCLYKNLFYKYDFESGELEFMGENLEEFSNNLLSNYNYYTGYSIAKEWQNEKSPILFNEVLTPKLPFILGGEYNIKNLYLYDIKKSIALKNKILTSIRNFNDGDRVRLII